MARLIHSVRANTISDWQGARSAFIAELDSTEHFCPVRYIYLRLSQLWPDLQMHTVAFDDILSPLSHCSWRARLCLSTVMYPKDTPDNYQYIDAVTTDSKTLMVMAGGSQASLEALDKLQALPIWVKLEHV